MIREELQTMAADSIQYWERRRILYNAVLATIVIVYFTIGLPEAIQVIEFDFILELFLLTVIANILYCVAYVPDMFIQMAGLDQAKKKVRLVILTIGLLFASIITRFLAMELFLYH